MRKTLSQRAKKGHQGQGNAPLHRGRRRWRSGEKGIPIGVSFAPMIDVTFLLLIFFLVTTTFERAEGILSSDLPEVETVPAVPLPFSPIVVRLAQSGPGHDDFTISVDRFPDAPDNLEALPVFLRQVQQQPGFDEKTPVVIVAQESVRWDHVVGCWNAALRAGCKRIAFGKP